MKKIRANPKNIKFVCSDLDHPEDLALDLQGNLYAGGELGQIYYINIKTGKHECIAKTGGFILGITLDGKNQIYACDSMNHQIIKCLPDGRYTIFAKGTKKIPLMNPNYSVFDREGRLFFSDSGNFQKSNGRIWVKEPKFPAFPLTSPELPFPNGMFLDSEEEYLYVVLSTVSEISRFKIQKNSLKNRETIIKLPSQIIPDGIAMDNNRNLWIACFKPDAVLKISKQNKIEMVIEDPMGILINRPTNLVLKENEVLFANLGGRHIGSFNVDVMPLELNYPYTKVLER